MLFVTKPSQAFHLLVLSEHQLEVEVELQSHTRSNQVAILSLIHSLYESYTLTGGRREREDAGLKEG